MVLGVCRTTPCLHGGCRIFDRQARHTTETGHEAASYGGRAFHPTPRSQPGHTQSDPPDRKTFFSPHICSAAEEPRCAGKTSSSYTRRPAALMPSPASTQRPGTTSSGMRHRDTCPGISSPRYQASLLPRASTRTRVSASALAGGPSPIRDRPNPPLRLSPPSFHLCTVYICTYLPANERRTCGHCTINEHYCMTKSNLTPQFAVLVARKISIVLYHSSTSLHDSFSRATLLVQVGSGRKPMLQYLKMFVVCG